LGDHKQLRPIVKNEHVRRLGMTHSLFERYMDRALLLDTQYRMVHIFASHTGYSYTPLLLFFFFFYKDYSFFSMKKSANFHQKHTTMVS